jgi:hypothetical protein
MKIVNKKTFLTLPANTLFHKYSPDIFGQLQIKTCNPTDTWTNDFIYSTLYGDIENRTCGLRLNH